MTDPRLPELPLGASVLDLIEILLRAARYDPFFAQWAELKTGHADVIDLIRGDLVEPGREIRTSILEGPNATQLVDYAASAYPSTPGLVLVAALARGLDDLYGDFLEGPWLEKRLAVGPLAVDELVVVPGSAHLRSMFAPGASLSVGQTRAAERPDQTRRCRLYDPSAAAPPIRFANDLTPHLSEVLAGAAFLATAHPTASTDELTMSFPVVARDAADHLAACEGLLSAAFAEHVAVVVFPEFTGYPAVTDRLRQLTPTTPALVVAGSGHVSAANRRRNRSLVWIARKTGNIPVGAPLAVDKMVPYDGSLGSEPLTDTGEAITVQVDAPWRAAFGICRDLLNNDAIDALSQLGVNLVAVPACSPKTTNLATNAAALAANGPGLAIVANGPRYFHDERTGSDIDVPLAVFATPLDQVPNPRHIETCDPPGLCVYDAESNTVAPTP